MADPASLVSIATLEPVRIDDEFYERVAQLLAIRGGDDINDRCCTIPRPGGDRATTVGTLRRFNERRLVVARKRTHEISNIDAVELISADPHEEYRDRGRSHPMTTDAAWVVHEWTYSGTVDFLPRQEWRLPRLVVPDTPRCRDIWHSCVCRLVAASRRPRHGIRVCHAHGCCQHDECCRRNGAQVFDKALKLAQRSRAALGSDEREFEYLRDEVANRLTDRLQESHPAAAR